jgi:hypothetical protein
MQTVFEKCPFKKNGKLLKLFCLILRSLNCQWGLIPRRTKSCEVSDPAEQDPAGYHSPRNQVLRGIRPRRTMTEMCIFYSRCLFCGVWQNNVLRGLILRLTKSCRVSDPAEQSSAGYHTPGNNFKYEYFREFETEFKNILGCEFGDYMGSIHGKNWRLKISCYCPFNLTLGLISPP